MVSVVKEDQKGGMPCRGKSVPKRQKEASAPQKRKSAEKEARESRRGRSSASYKGKDTVMPCKHLGKISDILHLNNENNQLKRRVWPPQRCSLDAQSWTRAYHLSSRVVAMTTTTETS